MASRLNVIFEDNHLLVVDKPALLPTMGVAEGEDSLVVRAKDYLRQKYNKPGNVFLGVVSRLDAFASGVIVLARTSKAASRLSEQFRTRTVQKTYLAIVPDLKNFPQRGVLENRIIKNEHEHRMEAVTRKGVPLPAEQIAVLSYHTIGHQDGQRLLEVDLKTGRKHQIRVQLSAAGCPIIGDRKYDSRESFPAGIALHCAQIVIQHPTLQNWQTFRSAPPLCWKLERFGYDEWACPPPKSTF